MKCKRLTSVCGALLMVLVLTSDSPGQLGKPKSYSDYYKSAYGQTLSPARAVNPARYTADKYFYKNPAISPYSNLTRRSGPSVNNYQAYVRPEQKRRTQERIGQIQSDPRRAALLRPQIEGVQKTMGGARSSRPTSRSVNPYHNQWYGGRQQMGLR